MITRPDLADADGVEVTAWIVEHSTITDVQTAVADDAMQISSGTATDAELNAALVGFVPTAPAGEYVYVPPTLRGHKDHLRAYAAAERDGSLAGWTQAEFRQRTAHALADVIEYVRRNVPDA